MKFNTTFTTIGDGFWSSTKKGVACIEADVPYIAEDGKFGELRVYFDTKSWNINEHGLIYTDSCFKKELRSFLVTQGLTQAAADDVGYSEQGMQGDNYVSLDVGEKFLKEWVKLEGA